MSDGWYYADGENSVGPNALDELQNVLRRRRDASRILVWREGFQDWVEAGSVPELSAAVTGPPPIPRRVTVQSVASEKPASSLSPEYRQITPPEGNTKKWAGRGATIVGWVGGFALARVFGGAFWIPAFLIWLSYWLFTKLKVVSYVALMLAILTGHTLWMIVGHATLIFLGKTSPDLMSLGYDLVIVTIALIWCIRKQSVASCILVLVYQLIALSVSSIYFDEYFKGSQIGATMHISLRVMGAGLAVYAIVQITRRKSEFVKQGVHSA